MTPAQRAVVKSYGGWTAFCQAYGLKPTNDDDKEEAFEIVKRMAANDEAEHR